MQKQKNISTLVGIIIIIVVAVVLFGGLFAWQYFLAKSQPVVQTQSQTAGWKTYINDKYGFEFQYPSSLILSNSELVYGCNTNLNGYGMHLENGRDGEVLNLLATCGKINTTSGIPLRPIVVGNKSGYEYQTPVYKNSASGPVEIAGAVGVSDMIDLGNSTFLQIDFDSLHAPIDYTRQILSTFKFTNPTTTFNWEGTYEFDETAKALAGYTMGESYVLSISSADGRWHLGLSVDGFQTELRILATANNVGDSLDVIFDSYDSLQKGGLKKGDVMFTLTPTSSGLAIKWKKMQPNFTNTDVNNSFFVKK